MVAYSFHQSFADRVERRLKLNTIRGHRRRHARPGEPMQLYTGMRTKSCRKLVDPDPICRAVDEVRFDLRSLAEVEQPLSNAACLDAFADVSIEVNGMPFDEPARHAFAHCDGFVARRQFKATGETVLPFFDMVMFWMAMYGPILFEGVCLRWEHQP